LDLQLLADKLALIPQWVPSFAGWPGPEVAAVTLDALSEIGL
jgi:hypothetical protein